MMKPYAQEPLTDYSIEKNKLAFLLSSSHASKISI